MEDEAAAVGLAVAASTADSQRRASKSNGPLTIRAMCRHGPSKA